MTIDSATLVKMGLDRYDENRSLGVSEIAFKVAGQGEDGLFILENSFHQPGGPARHLHLDQDEWFYVVEGDFAFEVGEQAFRMHFGDSMLAPSGKISVAFFPAGKMELLGPPMRLPLKAVL